MTRLEKQWNTVKKVFPGCIKTYPDCPTEIPDPNAPPAQCRTCPVYLQE